MLLWKKFSFSYSHHFKHSPARVQPLWQRPDDSPDNALPDEPQRCTWSGSQPTGEQRWHIQVAFLSIAELSIGSNHSYSKHYPKPALTGAARPFKNSGIQASLLSAIYGMKPYLETEVTSCYTLSSASNSGPDDDRASSDLHYYYYPCNWNTQKAQPVWSSLRKPIETNGWSVCHILACQCHSGSLTEGNPWSLSFSPWC